MSDAPADRVTILEMEIPIINGRLDTIDRRLALIDQRLADLTVAANTLIDSTTEHGTRLTGIAAKLDLLLDHFGLPE